MKIKIITVCFFLSFWLCSIAKAQNNNDSSFYLVDVTLITGRDHIFISSNLNINQQKIYVDVNTIFYDSGFVSSDIKYINNIRKNI